MRNKILLVLLVLPLVAATCELDTDNASAFMDSLSAYEIDECTLELPEGLNLMVGSAEVALQVGEDLLVAVIEDGTVQQIINDTANVSADYVVNISQERLDSILGSEEPVKQFMLLKDAEQVSVQATSLWGKVKLWVASTVAPLFL